MEKPHTGLDECPRFLLSCSRARISDLVPGPEGAAVSECAVGVKDGRTVEHPVAEMADDAGTIAE